jgi:hypothetical protein
MAVLCHSSTNIQQIFVDHENSILGQAAGLAGSSDGLIIRIARPLCDLKVNLRCGYYFSPSSSIAFCSFVPVVSEIILVSPSPSTNSHTPGWLHIWA